MEKFEESQEVFLKSSTFSENTSWSLQPENQFL
jgi:hypothetical protein